MRACEAVVGAGIGVDHGLGFRLSAEAVFILPVDAYVTQLAFHDSGLLVLSYGFSDLQHMLHSILIAFLHIEFQ
jgi:hypothetical protein